MSEPTQNSSSAERMENAMKAMDDPTTVGIHTDEVEEVIKEQELATPAEEPKESKSEYYANLTKKDKELRQLKQELKKYQEGKDYKKMATEDPMSVLTELGIPLDKIIDAWTKTPTTENNEEKSANKDLLEVGKIKKELEELKQYQQRVEFDQAVNKELLRIDKMVNESVDKYELISAFKDEGSYEFVLEQAADYYKNEGITPDITVVLDAVEQYFEAIHNERIEKLQKLNKFKTRFNIEKDEAIKQIRDPKSKAEKPQAAAPTLAMAMSNETAAPKKNDENERYARALEILKAQGD